MGYKEFGIIIGKGSAAKVQSLEEKWKIDKHERIWHKFLSSLI